MAAIDTSRPLRTRNGTRVTILCSNARGDMSIVGMVHNEKEDEIYTWRADGAFQPSGDLSCLDLVYVDERKAYLPVYDDGSVGDTQGRGWTPQGLASPTGLLFEVDPQARFILELVYDGRRLENVNVIRRGEVAP